jgi:hypothetical protein
MKRLDEKLARIRGGQYRPTDFIIADAKDPDVGPSLTAAGPKRSPDGTWTRYRTREEFLDQMRALIEQDIVDIMLGSAGNIERLVGEGRFRNSAITPAFRANETTDIWLMRGATYNRHPSRPFRTPSLAHARKVADLCLYSVTFNNNLDADVATLEAFRDFRRDAETNGLRYFLEVFNPNVETGIAPDVLPHYINDCIARCLAGLTQAERPLFLKLVYNGPKALEELASWDPAGLIVGVLGGGAGTTRDCFELLAQAERYGARVALFGRKINLAESPLEIVRMMREVASRNITPTEAVRAYHGALQREGIKPLRPLEEDLAITEPVLKQAASA